MSRYLLVVLTFLFVVGSLTTSSLAQLGDEGRPTTVFAILPESPGANCANGGSLIASGLDYNGNGNLNFNEIQQIGYACNGDPGPQGPAGPQGLAGADGAPGPQGPAGAVGPAGPIGATGPQGTAGADGAPGLDGDSIAITSSAPDAGVCPNDQGVKLEGGPDADGNNIPDSILFTEHICDGEQGPQGPTGPQGLAGADGADGSQGPQGEQGHQGVQGNVGPQGPAGADGADGTNGVDGVDGQDGADGTSIAIIEDNLLPGECASGSGVSLSIGLDTDSDGFPDSGVVDRNICDGEAGADGTTGPQGPRGFPGLDGADGEDGQDAISNTIYAFIVQGCSSNSNCSSTRNCVAGEVLVDTTCGFENPDIVNVWVKYAGESRSNDRTSICNVRNDSNSSHNYSHDIVCAVE